MRLPSRVRSGVARRCAVARRLGRAIRCGTTLSPRSRWSCSRENVSVWPSADIIASMLRLRLAPLHPQAVDFALHVLEPPQRLLQNHLRAPFGLAHDARGFLRRVLAHVVGKLLRAHQRVLQAAFEIAKLTERTFETRDLLTQAIVLAQRHARRLRTSVRGRSPLPRGRSRASPSRTWPAARRAASPTGRSGAGRLPASR